MSELWPRVPDAASVLPPDAARDLRVFRNALCILRSLDRQELVDAEVIAPDEWPYFRDEPWRRFLRLPDDKQVRCWGLVVARLPADLR